MKAYLLITGTMFALIGVMHLGRLVMRMPSSDWPFDAVLGGLSAALAVWAFRLVATARRGAAAPR